MKYSLKELRDPELLAKAIVWNSTGDDYRQWVGFRAICIRPVVKTYLIDIPWDLTEPYIDEGDVCRVVNQSPGPVGDLHFVSPASGFVCRILPNYTLDHFRLIATTTSDRILACLETDPEEWHTPFVIATYVMRHLLSVCVTLGELVKQEHVVKKTFGNTLRYRINPRPLIQERGLWDRLLGEDVFS